MDELKIDIHYVKRNISIDKLLYNIFYYKSNKINNIYLFFPILAIFLYKRITNNKININYYVKILKKNLKIIKKNKEFYKKVNTFRKILNEILNITQNNIELIDEEKIIQEKIYSLRYKELIFDKITKKIYKCVKDKVSIIKNGNYIIKKYKFINNYNNYCIVSIIREIILQIYAFVLCQKLKNIVIPKLYQITYKKHKNSETEISLIMEYINLENKITNPLKMKKSIIIYIKIKKILDYLENNKLFHNDTHNENLIILKNKIILLDFGKSTLYDLFSPSINGFPKINSIDKKSKKYINQIIDSFIFNKKIIYKYLYYKVY
jgi:tRNA A-37 threonylcarbamoyl transferase component Bud32